MNRTQNMLIASLGLTLFLLAGCGDNMLTTTSVGTPPPVVPTPMVEEPPLTAEEVKAMTIERAEAATAVLASNQHAFRFDGTFSRTLTLCDGTICGVSPSAAALEGALARARTDPRADFGSAHFAGRLNDSLTLAPEPETVGGVTLVEGFGLRTGDRPFSAEFYGGWLDEGAFFVNRTTLTVRDARGQPTGLGTVFDSSALGVASATAPMALEGMSGTWKGMMIGADVSNNVTRGQFIRGDATLVISDFANPDLDITFENLQDLETGAMLDHLTIAPWEDLPIEGSAFGMKPVGSDDYVQGRFVGETHSGAVGVFERSAILGSFGATRQPPE